MSNDNTDGWFDDSEMRAGAPSAKFKELGDSVVGEVVDKYKIDYVKVGEKEPELDKDGEVVKQLVIVLQTDQRNWEGVSKIPVDKDGNAKAASEDDGRRAVYARKWTNIYAALGASIRDSKVDNPSQHPALGGKFGIQFFEEEDTGKPSKLKKFRAKYTPPAPKAKDDGWFDGDKSETPADTNLADTVDKVDKAKAATTITDEPPF